MQTPATSQERHPLAAASGNGSLPKRLLAAISRQEEARFFPNGWARLRECCAFQLVYTDVQSPEDWPSLLLEVDPEIVLSCWTTSPLTVLAERPGAAIRYVAHAGGSVRALVPRALLERGVLVTNWGGLVAPAVAEHTLLLILGALRNAAAWPLYLGRRQDKWKLATRKLNGLRVGLHGFGRVARALVPLLEPFGVTLRAYSPGVPREDMELLGVTYTKSLPDLFSTVDIIVECESLTPANRGVVTREILCLLPADAVFVNVGRAGVVDETALRELITSGRLRGALDVHEQEEWPTDSAWWHVPNVLHSPHIAGPTFDGLPDCGSLALENIDRYLRGETLLNGIDLSIYDRST